MAWAKRAGVVASALVAAAAGGATLGVVTRPSPDSIANHHQASAPALAGGVVRSLHRARPHRPATPRTPTTTTSTSAPSTTTATTPAPTTTTSTTLPAPVFTAANRANPYVAALAARLAPVVAATPGCLLVTQGSTELYQSNPAGLVVPGSTQKLLLAAAALDVLGPDYTFTTEVVAPAAPVNGTVSGLWLVGGGDPVLEEPAFNAWLVARPRYRGDAFTDVDTLAAAVRARGVTTVTGGIHGDDARYDGVRLNPYWPADAEADGDIAPMSALTLDMGYESWTTNPAVIPADPASFAAASFAQLLRSAGVSAPDNPEGTDGPPPAGSVVIASIQSPPLSVILGSMLRPSDNQIAELLVKELGYHAAGIGTTAAGLAVVRAVDARLGIPWDGTVMVDGSGLSQSDRTTCQTLMAAFYLGDKPGFSAIPEGLATAGVNGTLAARFTTPPLLGHLLAKTGSIAGAVGMVGEVYIGQPVRFALVFNQPVSDSALINDENNAINAIAPYP